MLLLHRQWFAMAKDLPHLPLPVVRNICEAKRDQEKAKVGAGYVLASIYSDALD